MVKNIRWKLKSGIMDYIDARGAGFLEEKYIRFMLEDALEVYAIEGEDTNIHELIISVVDYYLDHIFKPHTEEGVNVLESLEDEGVRDKNVQGIIGAHPGERGGEGGDDEAGRVSCRICGGRYKVLYPHLIAKHYVDIPSYRKMFPNAPLRAGLPEKEEGERQAKERSKKSSDIRKRIIALAKDVKNINGARIF